VGVVVVVGVSVDAKGTAICRSLLRTLRLEDESFIGETYYIHLKIVKIHSTYCVEINAVFPF
jgi:hypothetical protein